MTNRFFSVIVVVLFVISCKPNKNSTYMAADRSVVEVILQRKSVRTYTSKDVSDSQIDTLLRAAMAAPSSRNVRPWHFYVVRNDSIKQRLADRLPTKIFPKAPVLIVVCGDPMLKNNEPDQVFNWALDCSAASQNILLAAESMGLGAVWTGVFPYKTRVAAVREVLGMPEHLVPLNIIPIGYPGGDEKPKDKYDPTKVDWK